MHWTWLLMASSLLGMILNIFKLRVSFFIWFFSNICWSAYNYHVGVYSQGTLLAIYAILAAWGWFAWKKEEPVAVCATCRNISCPVSEQASKWGIRILGCESYFKREKRKVDLESHE